MLRRIVHPGLWLFAAASLARAQGGPPMLTDDPGTPERGHWEINSAWTTEWSDAGNEQELPLVDINYGLRDNVQLKYEAAWVRLRDAGHDELWGLSNSTVGVKWRFHDKGEAGWLVSVYPQIEFVNPGSDSVRQGIAEDGTTTALPFQFQRKFESFDLNFDVGFAHNSRQSDGWFGGIAIGRELSDAFEGAIEIHALASSGFDETEVIGNVGIRWKVAESLSILCSIGMDLHNSSGERTECISYLGVQWRH